MQEVPYLKPVEVGTKYLESRQHIFRRRNRELNKINKEVARSIENVLPSAVSIRTATEIYDPTSGEVGTLMGIGAGFVIASDKNTAVIATNAHVALGAEHGSMVIETSGMENKKDPGQKTLIPIESNPIFVSQQHDIAFISLDLRKYPGLKLPAVTLGNSGDLNPGQAVLSVGSPHALTETIDTNHIAHNSAVEIPMSGSSDNYIQLSGSIKEGNSGGMVVDHSYRTPIVVGMVTLGIDGDPTTGFMLPAEVIQSEFERLQRMTHPRRMLQAA